MRMTTTAPPALKHTPFYKFHVEHGAKMVDYTGWEMPLHYGSIIDEHRQVRTSGGLFDVSHMGRIKFAGRDACRFLDRICTRQIHGMTDGQARYSLVCNEHGGCHDDVLIYRFDDSEYLMVCNAANRAKILEHIAATRGDLTFQLKDQTEDTAMIAIQGPKVIELISSVSKEVPALKRYRFVQKSLLFVKFTISRTGYTGEDGVEVIFPGNVAAKAVEMLMKQMKGDDAAIKPVGLGARDSLRLEAGMPLYGHELTEEIDPISAGLNFAVTLDKGETDPAVEKFIGQVALKRIAADGPKRKLVGLVLEGRRSARQDMKVSRGGKEIGFVTSGCLSPTLDKPIAMAYLDAEYTKPGEAVQISLGSATAEAKVTTLPFYKPNKS